MINSLDKKYPEGSEMWCWRWMEQIFGTVHVKNDIYTAKEENNILYKI
jgi:hypothetical protein